MNKEELENKINELEKQLRGLKEELNKPESKVWKPEQSDIYYYIDNCGTIVREIYTKKSVDLGRLVLGNCFRTEKEAEFAVEKLKVTAELKMFAEEHNIVPLDWDNKYQNKYVLRFTSNVECFEYFCTVRGSEIYFGSKELAKQAIKEIGEDRLKKYYFGVE